MKLSSRKQLLSEAEDELKSLKQEAPKRSIDDKPGLYFPTAAREKEYVVDKVVSAAMKLEDTFRKNLGDAEKMMTRLIVFKGGEFQEMYDLLKKRSLGPIKTVIKPKPGQKVTSVNTLIIDLDNSKFLIGLRFSVDKEKYILGLPHRERTGGNFVIVKDTYK